MIGQTCLSSQSGTIGQRLRAPAEFFGIIRNTLTPQQPRRKANSRPWLVADPAKLPISPPEMAPGCCDARLQTENAIGASTAARLVALLQFFIQSSYSLIPRNPFASCRGSLRTPLGAKSCFRVEPPTKQGIVGKVCGRFQKQGSVIVIKDVRKSSSAVVELGDKRTVLFATGARK